LDKITAVITKVLSVFLIILMAVIVLDVTWQIFTRFILQHPSSFTEELAGFLLIWIGLLGASYAYFKHAHLGIDILTARLTGGKRITVEVLINLIVLLFALFVLVIGGFRLVDITFTLNQISPSLEIPMGYVYLVLPLTGLLMMYYSIYFILRILKRGKIEEEKEEIIPVD
jgi:TRAP-type C4-dicarboxylate transport system permease small subunit